MINEQMTVYMQTLEARITVLEDFIKAKHPDFPTTPKGTSGTLTPVEPAHSHGDEAPFIGYVTPIDDYANIRNQPNLGKGTFVYQLLRGEYKAAKPVRVLTGPGLQGPIEDWYQIEGGHFARADVVTFTPDKPMPISPINAALWPAPVSGYSITNHDGHSHDGLDYSCAFGTPIQAGPNGGHVVKAFTCTICNARQGDGKTSLQDPSKAYGYGSHVVVRYAYDSLPQAVKNAIPNGAYTYAIHAHLSKVFVSQGQRLDPYQVIGEVGATGNTYSIGGGEPSHLHYSLRWSTHPDAAWSNMNNNRINPSLLVKA